MSKNDMVMGDPVALPERHCDDQFSEKLRDKAEGWNACLDEIAKLGPLFGRPAQGEPVAWVRFRNGEPDYDGDACMIMNVPGDTLGDGDSWEAVYAHPDTRVAGYALAMREQSKEHVSEVCDLRAQLAEAHELLREVHGGMWPSNPLTIKIGSHLSASAEPSAPVVHPINMKTMMRAYEQVDHKSLLHGTSNWCAAMATALRGVLDAEPSAPVEIDECAEFEAAWSARIERLRIRERGNEFYRVQPNDLYRWSNVQDAWELWQARAALEHKP